jgi:hypothetical protein
MRSIPTVLLGSPRRALATVVGAIVLLGVLYWAVPPVRDLGAFAAVVIIGAAFLIKIYPNEAKQLSGRLLAYLAWTNRAVERESIRQDIEGTVSAGIEELVRACPDAAVGSVRIEFVRSAEQAEHLPDGTLVLGIAEHRDRIHNLVAAAWAYARHGVLINARPHLDRDVSRGIDFTVAKAILSGGDGRAVGEFITAIWQPEIANETKLRELTAKLEVLEQDRVFAPILLEEFARLGTRLVNQLPRDEVARESAAFVEHLYCLADPQHEQDRLPFDGKWIRCGFVLSATSEVLSSRGSSAYTGAVLHAVERAYPRVYLMAWGKHAEVAREVVAAVRKDPRVLNVKLFEEQVPGPGGVRPRLVAQISVDVREYVGIGQRPIVAVGGAYEDSIARQRRETAGGRDRRRSPGGRQR